jgi:hypothetical protein
VAGYGWSNSDTLTKSPWPSSSLSSWMTWIYSTPTSQRSGHSLNEKENMITISPELPDWNTLPWNYPQLILSFDRFLDDSIPAHMWSNHTTQHSTKQDKTRQDKTRQDKTRQDKTRQNTIVTSFKKLDYEYNHYDSCSWCKCLTQGAV